jgi:hypothetical protein
MPIIAAVHSESHYARQLKDVYKLLGGEHVSCTTAIISYERMTQWMGRRARLMHDGDYIV